MLQHYFPASAEVSFLWHLIMPQLIRDPFTCFHNSLVTQFYYCFFMKQERQENEAIKIIKSRDRNRTSMVAMFHGSIWLHCHSQRRKLVQPCASSRTMTMSHLTPNQCAPVIFCGNRSSPTNEQNQLACRKESVL